MKEKMNKAGYAQGDMKPKVEDYQKPMSAFSQSGFSKPDAYIERQDAQQKGAAKDVSKQSYKGRYS